MKMLGSQSEMKEQRVEIGKKKYHIGHTICKHSINFSMPNV